MSESRSFDRVWERTRDRGRISTRVRFTRLRGKAWHVGQSALAAGIAWWLAKDFLGHPQPFFAPIVAVVCLGTSYGQRLRRVAEVTIGVAVGVLLADVLVRMIGSGAWQLSVIVALSMSIAFLLNAGALFVSQAAVQSIVVVTLVASPQYTFIRWTDALVGGAVALAAAAIVPGAPLRRPREQAAAVIRRISELLRAASELAIDGDIDRGLAVLRDARATEILIRELQAAADEGRSVLASSPFRRRQSGQVRRMAELVEPMDRALRNTRVLVRRVAVANYHRETLPPSHARLCTDLADAADTMAQSLARDEMPSLVRAKLMHIGQGTASVERSGELSADVVLAQIRSIIVDLLQITGLDVLEATDALPPAPR